MIVVTVIGILTAIAVPRISGAAQGAKSSALQATVTNVREAIDGFYAEHHQYPGYDPATKAPDGDRFIDQLTMYTDFAGNARATYGSGYDYGPYLRRPFPKNPFNKLDVVFVKATPGSAGPTGGTAGWVTVLSHGYFTVAATGADLERIGVDIKLWSKLATE
ncbi:MAG: hypothetical protein IID45_03465 [Planctomycetes bacterium]|nr:hypothetical protein [Planctomycetota bacterium]